MSFSNLCTSSLCSFVTRTCRRACLSASSTVPVEVGAYNQRLTLSHTSEQHSPVSFASSSSSFASCLFSNRLANCGVLDQLESGCSGERHAQHRSLAEEAFRQIRRWALCHSRSS